PGPLRLLNSALGGQAGWLLGFALVALLALALASRLRRSDAGTGWLLAVGGGFAVTAILFSAASGIFHPYYVSLLAPFTAALVGLLIAPAAWSVDTLGYAASGTFPLGGPASAQSGPGGRDGFGMRPGASARGGLPGRPPLGGAVGGLGAPDGQAGPAAAPPSGAGGGPGAGAALPGLSLPAGRAGAGGPLGGLFGGDSSLKEALSYIKSRGGGTLAVSSQTSA